jgi:hypothetical protein
VVTDEALARFLFGRREATRYYVLTRHESGETIDNPGALVRRVVDDTGLRFEILLGDGTWEDRTPSLIWITMHPTHDDATRITSSDAAALIRRWPPSKLRPGFKAPR